MMMNFTLYSWRLGPEYGPFVTSVTTCDTHIRLSDLQGLLLSEEIRVSEIAWKQQNISINVAAKTSNTPTHGKAGSRGRGRYQQLNRWRGRSQYNNRGPSQSHFNQGSSPNALYASQSYPNEIWYPDTGATNHITPDLANLSLHSDHNGNDKVKVGNGKGLHKWKRFAYLSHWTLYSQ